MGLVLDKILNLWPNLFLPPSYLLPSNTSSLEPCFQEDEQEKDLTQYLSVSSMPVHDRSPSILIVI